MEDSALNDELEKEINYKFLDKSKLLEARTHTSFKNENGGEDNSRLEHLGDAVLTLIVLSQCYDQNYSPGQCDSIKQKLVNNERLADFGKKKQLGRYLRVGEGSKAQKHYENPEALADFIEAIIGAVFRDGGYDAAKGVIQRLNLLSQSQ